MVPPPSYRHRNRFRIGGCRQHGRIAGAGARTTAAYLLTPSLTASQSASVPSTSGVTRPLLSAV